jgi:hypothetical protein
MRLDDDSFMMEEIIEPLFDWNYDYIYRLEQTENQNYMMYFEDFITEFCRKKKIKVSFDANIVFNNFFIVDLRIYQDKDVIEYLKSVYHSGGIYYCRWGDALIQSFIFKLFPKKFSITQVKFDYGKWGITYSREDFNSFQVDKNSNQVTPVIIIFAILLSIFVWYIIFSFCYR